MLCPTLEGRAPVPARQPPDIRSARLPSLAGAVALIAACSRHPVGPARTFGAYEAKAVTTAESARSSVETVRLASEAGDDHDGFGPYLSVLVSGREDALAQQYPVGRLGVPEDVGEAAAYLLGDGAAWVTGQTLVLDGGRLSRGR